MTRDEWIKMWNAIKAIENNAQAVYPAFTELVQANINLIKEKIEEEIGQLE